MWWCLGQCLICNKLHVAVSCYTDFIFVAVIIIPITMMMTGQHPTSLLSWVAFLGRNASRIHGLLCLPAFLFVRLQPRLLPLSFRTSLSSLVKVSDTSCSLGVENTWYWCHLSLHITFPECSVRQAFLHYKSCSFLSQSLLWSLFFF